MLDSSLIEFTIEFKTRRSQDPFQHGLDRNTDTGKNNPLMVTESTGSEMAGQVIAYTTLILSTHVTLLRALTARRWRRGFDY